jgi:pyruvate dehydrogenase E2 component (dihydrolipoamide acetyltransferase)
MASIISMPRLSDTMADGVLVKWHKKEGETVEPGQVLADVETDKAVQECEAFEKGTLLKLLAAEGDRIPVGAPIAVLGKAGEDISGLAIPSGAASPHKEPSKKEEPKPAAAPVPAPVKPAAPAPATPAAPAPVARTGRVLASPVARKIALESDLDIASVQGSGPNGRIIRRDVEAALAAPKPAATVAPAAFVMPAAWAENGESRPASSMRRTIARRLLESTQQTPTFYLTVEIDMDEAVAFRKLVHDPENGSPISFNDMVIKAMATALTRVPEAHAAWEGDSIHYFEYADISVAVATEEGLITPVVRKADQKSLGTIAREVRELVEKAKNRKLKPEEFTGGTFSVSNLGMFGIEEFTAIINPPEAAILAVGAIEKKPVVKGDAVVIGHRMRVTLTCDHRVIDGALGAKLLQQFKSLLEKPYRLAL